MQVSNLPQGQRDALKALLRAHPQFAAWRAQNGVKADGVTNAVIAKAITDLGLVDEARKVVGIAAPAVMVVEEVPSDKADEAPADEAPAVEVPEAPDVTANAIDADVATVLEPIRSFLSGSLIAAVEERLRPLAQAAHQPPILIEKAAPPRPGEAARAKRIGQSTMHKLFGVTGAQGKVKVDLWNDLVALAADPGYVVEPSRFYLAASALEHGECIWLGGEMGGGKTTMVREYAARTGRGFTRIGFTRATEIVDLLGQKEPEPGEFGSVKMRWQDHVFTQAVRRPGTVVLLDEVTICPPGTSAAFQTILDERRLTLSTGEVVPFADGAVVAVADNTFGYGDETGNYAGTQAANGALVDRAVRTIAVDYLPPALEAQALANRTGAPFPACERVANFAFAVRKAQRDAGTDARPFSIRRLVAFINATHRDLISQDEAWEITALSRLPAADRETLRQLIRAQFEGAAYKRELAGHAAQVEPMLPGVSTPEQEDARKAFDPVNP